MAARRGPGEKHKLVSFISAGVVGFSARISALKGVGEGSLAFSLYIHGLPAGVFFYRYERTLLQWRHAPPATSKLQSSPDCTVRGLFNLEEQRSNLSSLQ